MAKKKKINLPLKGRKGRSREIRKDAARLAAKRPHPPHRDNWEEGDSRYNFLSTFRKGLPHDSDGKVEAKHSKAFKKACIGLKLSAFDKIEAGSPGNFRGWESPTAGGYYELEGPDPQSVTMPPAPDLDSEELAAEMAEVYLMALLRDVPFTDYTTEGPSTKAKENYRKVGDAVAALNSMVWFQDKKIPGLSKAAKERRRGEVTRENLFRGTAAGASGSPYISQFLLAGNVDIAGKPGETPIPFDEGGLIEFGAQRNDQRIRTPLPGLDFMVNLESWLEVQNGTDIPNIREENFVDINSRAGSRTNPPPHRFITTARDLSNYVHYDQLYQAYLNACLLLLGSRFPLQNTFPHDSIKNTKGFAQFGGPQVLTLVTEVATRALKAVRFQKFTVHRRARPEQLAGLVHQFLAFENKNGKNPFKPMKKLVLKLAAIPFGDTTLLEAVKAHNELQKDGEGYFLPMAFEEGSPMHPAYGAGHATVAGACVTVLKAFFDTTQSVSPILEADPDKGGKILKKEEGELNVEDELNKLAANISIGRNMGGVHYFTDYYESVKMGEQIAIELLEEQALTYTERFSMSVNKFFSGKKCKIKPPRKLPKP